ncbi:hypothetical protein [Qipengyuania sediminis]|uniref:hypothetical protein n=1 Tax=Qipengyuania sediminis TaxID=1532023 RepID=UPI00105984A2|nr:hypothetical protein [Qipengyuania sediminis]
MNLWTMIFLIVLVGCATNVLTERYRAMGRIEKRARKESGPASTVDESAVQTRELQELRERIKVLERIATDGNSVDANETRRIAREIEALRGDQPG